MLVPSDSGAEGRGIAGGIQKKCVQNIVLKNSARGIVICSFLLRMTLDHTLYDKIEGIPFCVQGLS